MKHVEELRTRFARFLIAWIWANAALLVVVGFYRESVDTPTLVVAAGTLAVVATSSWWLLGTDWRNRQLSSVIVLGQVMMMVAALSGHAYQVELHLYFLASLAILSGWLDWRIFVTGTIALTVHHTGLSLLQSAAVFPGGNDLYRVLIHAVLVVLEATALACIVYYLKAALLTSEAESEAAEHARSVAEQAKADLLRATQEADEIRNSTLKLVADTFEKEVATIAKQVLSATDDLRCSAGQMTSGARRVTEHSEAAALSSEQASTNVVAVNRATSELATSIGEIDRSVFETVEIVEAASRRVDDVLSTVDKLALKAQGVGQIADTISEIAGRTNLLALNASIEAARAGEYGRGFAVVAGEVKALAGQTAAATSEIQHQIQAIRSSSDEAIGAIDAMNRTIATLRTISAAVSSVVEKQSTATNGIAANVGQAAQQTVTASGNIRIVSRFASEAGQVADFVALSADNLATTADELQTAVDQFLLRIRAA
jgi:methyl-accepting chemotaxis protein